VQKERGGSVDGWLRWAGVENSRYMVAWEWFPVKYNYRIV